MPGFCFTQACTAPLLLRIVRAALGIADAGPDRCQGRGDERGEQGAEAECVDSSFDRPAAAIDRRVDEVLALYLVSALKTVNSISDLT
jgi:hypothetical protein